MMALANVLLCFAVLHCIANAASDVCSNITYTTIDDIRRSTAYDTTTDLCDSGVIKDGSWYRFKSAAGDKMPEFNPGTNHCGTFIPIWMNGKHPARLGETVSRGACAAVPFQRPPGCSVKFDIKVVNCGGFFLYQLKEPKYCYAYCAGTKRVSQADLLPSSVKLRILNITVTPGRLHKVNYLKCAVEGDPSPDVWWTKADGSYIRGSEIRFRNNNRTFIIKNGQPKHDRTYYCHARNKFHYVNASFELKLIDVPRIDIIFYNNHDRHVFARWSSAVIPVQLFIGQEDERVRCSSSGYPNVRVTWKRNGIEIIDYLNRSSDTRVYQKRTTRTITGGSDLHFKKVYWDDAGNYTCESSIDGYDYVDIRYFELTAIAYANQKLDILLLFDGSTSVKRQNIKKVRRFLPKLVLELNVGRSNNHVALIQFSEKAKTKVEFGFNRYYEAGNIGRAIKSMTYQSGRKTMTGHALGLANDQLFTGQDGDRVEASDVVVLLADGGAHDRTQALENAGKLKRRGVHVVTIYIPNSTSDEKFKENLRDIASSHNNFYTLNFYEPKYVAADLVKNVCSKK